MGYLERIMESRYRTHGLATVRRQLPRILWALGESHHFDYNEATDDFQLYLTGPTVGGVLDVIVGRCEVIGYFPSLMTVDGHPVIYGNTVDEYVDFVKKYVPPEQSHILCIQFESWVDVDVEIPPILYHVCRSIDADKIRRYGLCPKFKFKISFHPERIYFSSNTDDVIETTKLFKRIEDDSYSVVIIDVSRTSRLKLRRDPNHNNAYYTTQSIPPIWIDRIVPIENVVTG